MSPAIAHAGPDESCSAAHVRAQVLKRDVPERLLERRAALQACSSAVCARSIIAACSGWSRDVDALMPSLIVRVVDSHGVAVANPSIRIDGKAEAVGVPIDVDPGEHTVAVVAGTTASRTVALRLGEKGHVVEIAMPPEAPLPSAPSSMPEKRGPTATRILAYVLGGVGIVAVGMGVGSGVVALNAARDRDGACGGDYPSCTDASKRHDLKIFQDRIVTAGNISTVAFVGGALLIVASVWLYFTSPDSRRAGLQPWQRALAQGRLGW
jgi:hypothetical protein